MSPPVRTVACMDVRRLPPESRTRLLWLLIGATVAARVVLLVCTRPTHSPDIVRYWTLGSLHGRPYVDFKAEYPLLTILLFKATAWARPDLSGFGWLLEWLTVAADVGIVVVLWRTWGRTAAAFYLLVALPMLTVVHAVDATSTFLAIAGVALWARGKPESGGLLVGVAALLKLWTAPFVLIGLAGARTGRRFTAAAMAVGATGLALWLVVGGVDGVRQVLTYRGAKGWEINSLPGAALLASHAQVLPAGGAMRVGAVNEAVRLLLLVLSLGVSSWAIMRSVRMGRLGAGWITSVAALLVFSSLLSPQYLFWLLPGAAIAWSQDERMLAFLVAAAGALSAVEMTHWQQVVAGNEAWVAVVIVRDLVLVAALAAGVVSLLHTPKTWNDPPTEVGGSYGAWGSDDLVPVMADATPGV